MKRSLVMLAGEFDPLKFKVAGAFLSEKLDGVRCLWLPSTRYKKFKTIPFANTARDDRDYECSGLWTRRGKIIVAPNWFLDQLPLDVPLDGELFAESAGYQGTVSAVRKLEPVDPEWKNIRYSLFDIPSYRQFYLAGQIREGGRAGEPAYEVKFGWDWGSEFRTSPYYEPKRFNEVQTVLGKIENENVGRLPQLQLPHSTDAALEVVYSQLAQVVARKGEGVMLRQPHSVWTPNRSPDLVKVKPLDDDEGTVVGFVPGNGRWEGMVGSLSVEWKGKRFDCGGLTERERVLDSNGQSKHFPPGTLVTFSYNGLTNDGIPRFPRYFRKREVE